MNELPAHVTLTEVGLRDGFQNTPIPIPTSVKLDILSRLVNAGLERIQVTAFVSPRLVPQMADAREICLALADLPTNSTEFSALALNVKGLERAHECGLKHIDISISADPVHSQKNTGMSLEQARKTMKKMIKRGQELNLQIHAGIQCAFGSAFNEIIPDSRIYDMTCEILDEQIDSFGLFDTTGMATPSKVKKILDMILPETGTKPFFFHFHDTYGKGTENFLSAINYGVSRFDTAFGGMGGCPFVPGARGNICTEDMVRILRGLNIHTGIDIQGVKACSLVMQNFR
ncbi:hydroxymethylglutaryl-CoA lyase [Candidatus Magnetomorum sp. HK-1]|nr:hydroxymethylglutaryl-CoA lyase [Candidatus Magnetomorum sp. HK-1]